MTEYIIRRFLLVIPTFLGITALVFLITRITPGGPLEQAIMEIQQMDEAGGDGVSRGGSSSQTVSRDSPLSEEQLEQLKKLYNLDKPWYVAYIHWLWDFVRLDFGTSFRYNEPVLDLLLDKLPVSFYFGLITFFLTYLVCIPLGYMKALTHNSFFDSFTSIFTFLGFAIPPYIVAIMALIFFGAELEWFPLSGFMSDYSMDMNVFEMTWDIIYHSVLPLIAYMVGSFAMITFYMKSFLMEQMSADYVRTAVAKGVSYEQAVIKHAFRNSIIPLVSGFTGLLTFFLAGNYLIEQIFSIDGFGLFALSSIEARDYPVVVGMAAITALISLVGTIITDFSVAVIDARVTYT